MSKKHLDRKAHFIRIGEHGAWYYEENKGLEVYVDAKGKKFNFTIPVASIRAYLRRKDK